jgi:hypothetical protein
LWALRLGRAKASSSPLAIRCQQSTVILRAVAAAVPHYQVVTFQAGALGAFELDPDIQVGDLIDHPGLPRARVTAVILSDDPEHEFTIIEVEPLAPV